MDSENDGLLPDNPYIVLSVERYECHHGPDRNKAKKNKPEAVPDHVYGKKRFLIQPTKKMDCPATIIAKEVIFFTDYKTSVSKWQREKISKDIKTGMMDDKKLNLKMDKRLVIKLPKKEEHKFHLQGEIEEISMPVDKRIVAKVEDYVTEGFISASCIRMLLDTFVRKELFAGQRSPSWTNRRFFPSQKDVSNLIYSTRLRAVKSKFDQENLVGCVEEWRRENPDDLIDFSPSDDTSRLLFIYQSRQQRRLLQRYGNEICFLDATYRTTKYSVPLFFLCVKTNMDYAVVAVFASQFEDTKTIAAALGKIKEWNSEWNPQFFMVDYCEAEINGIGTCFKGI
ncbi:uncharacterized protein LOC127733410 [Mytilus californianus]|uniref:uncharacterized protein LOC127733410 n=1 Tax=Mytilus californianus TaxID=6549 RepID=UPI0022461DD5|nr:uncharacterized protein LOC127733410 [Mytilus californianus]